MSATGEAEARRTPERAGRSPGPKGPTASDGGGRNAAVTSSAVRAEAARRGAIATCRHERVRMFETVQRHA